MTYRPEADGAEQNFVRVKEDWTNLKQKVKEVLESAVWPRGFPRKVWKNIREHYLTAAAEACSRRALIRGYGRVISEPNSNERDGMT